MIEGVDDGLLFEWHSISHKLRKIGSTTTVTILSIVYPSALAIATLRGSSPAPLIVILQLLVGKRYSPMRSAHSITITESSSASSSSRSTACAAVAPSFNR